MPSFDAVSKVDWSEVQNALLQAQREVGQRYDFKDTNATIEQVEKTLVVSASSEERTRAALDVLQSKLVRRKLSLLYFDAGEPQPGSKGSSRLVITVKEGIEKEKAKKMVQHLKDSKLKVQASIHEDSVRVSGKKRDDLQSAIASLRGADFEIELQFVNFRD